MISAIRELALLELNRRFQRHEAPLEQLRQEHGNEIAPLLVEASAKVPRAYLLQRVPERPDAVRMWVEDLDENKSRRLPFNKPSGSQSAAIGPVFKRTYKTGAQPPYGPTLKIQNTTREAFEHLSGTDSRWKSYFYDIYKILFQSAVLIYEEKCYEVGEGKPDPHILAAAIRLIPDKETVFLSVVDSAGCWPGDRSEYHAYLAHSLSRRDKLGVSCGVKVPVG